MILLTFQRIIHAKTKANAPLAAAQKEAIVDAETFGELYRTYMPAIFNYCLFRVNNRAVAEDLTADIFEKAWRARKRYQPEQAAVSTWLFTIARRVVIDWQRRQSRWALFRLTFRPATTVPSPETMVEADEQQAALRQLVRTLPQHEQELIALKFGAAMTNREIAPLLGKSETAVGSAIHRIMQKLRGQWQGNYE